MGNWSNYAPPVSRYHIGLAACVLQLARLQLHLWEIVSDPLHLARDPPMHLLACVCVEFPWDSMHPSCEVFLA